MCRGQAARDGVPVDADCLNDVDDELADDFADAEAAADCITVGDLGLVAAIVDAVGSVLSSALLPSTAVSACAERKLAITGAAAERELRCHAKGVADGLPIDGACLAGAGEYLAAGFVRAEEMGDCLTTGDAGSVESVVDGVADGFAALLAGSPSGAFVDGPAGALL